MTIRTVDGPRGRSDVASGTSSLPSERLTRSIFSTGLGIAVRPKNWQPGSLRRDDEENAPATGAAKKKVFYTIVKTDLLIPGDGDPLEDAALVIEGKLIVWVGAAADLPGKYAEAGHHRAFSVPVVMPGLWDVHTHFDGGGPEELPSYLSFVTEHPASQGARLARQCWESLQRGYGMGTSLRDVAGYGCEIAKAIDDGSIVGPNIYSSGGCLSQLAGHGDVFPLPAGDVLLNLGVGNITAGHHGTSMSLIVDGVDECRRAVRLQIRRGAKCIKVLASGGVLSLNDDVDCAQFSAEELACIVAEARRQKRNVAAHVHAKEGILQAIHAGVKTLEHVSFADEEVIELVKDKNVIWVATRTVIQLLLDSGGEGVPRKSWDKALRIADASLAGYKQAIADGGVTFALGTDTPPGFNMAMELELAVQCGMTNLEVIQCATANGPLTVGEQAPKTGQLKVGYEADILGLTENPVEDVRILQQKENIKYVWKGGVLFKGPGVGPWGENYVFG
ncbi:Amidohydrolase [Apiospora rasikravindrae]|uniref:Amidohydrolase n=1 Tax=Apiospora rasikravindrae TaxID=990691 RepID=A0ABR1UFD3_9PEZI